MEWPSPPLTKRLKGRGWVSFVMGTTVIVRPPWLLDCVNAVVCMNHEAGGSMFAMIHTTSNAAQSFLIKSPSSYI